MLTDIAGQPQEIGGTTFISTEKKTPPKGFSLVEYGYKPDGEGVAPEYLVRVSSLRNKCTVVGVLQEDISTRVESVWSPFLSTSALRDANMLVQALTSRRDMPSSLITPASSRRIWEGSTPMIISLKLKFEAVVDPYTEVTEPCRLLQTMALPSEPDEWRKSGLTGLLDIKDVAKDVFTGKFSQALSRLPFLVPPGPTPFTTEGILYSTRRNLQEKSYEELKGGDKIFVEIGRFLSFWNVIIKEVPVLHHIKFALNGDPISAEANVVFETYEMMTVQSLQDSYDKKNMSAGANNNQANY